MRQWPFLLLALATSLGACRERDDEPVTAAQALQALDESAASSQASALVGNTVEITTNFTIGQAVETAAEELAQFYASQLPCAEVTLDGGKLTVEYGVKAGNCTYNGHTFSGSHSVSISANDMSQVIVDHEWTEVSNGLVSVTGTATVSWDFDDASRNVVHELTWTRDRDGLSGTGSGDRTQTALAGGVLEGIEIDGTRMWEGQRGTWELAIDGVEVRWIDPVPQAGTYTLVTPFDDKSVSLSFERVDEDTIAVTLASGKKEFSFDVSKAGAIEQTDES